MNHWITFFTEAINLLSSCFVDIRYKEGTKAEADSFGKIADALAGCKRRPGKCGYMLIRSRGLGETPMTVAANGYELVTRDIAVDTVVTAMKIREAGSRMSFLSDTLSQAFEVFSANNITSVYLKIPSRLPEDLDRLKDSLRILSSFVQAAKTDSPVVFKRNGEQFSIPLVKDERGRPHPNLTMVMGLNNLDPKQTQELVQKVDSWVRDLDANASDNLFVDVYDTMKSSPKFQQLLKPPIEMNNVRWLMADSELDYISNEKIQVARSVLKTLGDSPHTVAQVLASIYGSDFERINARVLGKRLILISSFLDEIEKEKEEETVLKEVVGNITNRFALTREDVRHNLRLAGNTLHVQSNGVENILGMIHPKCVKMIQSFSDSQRLEEKPAEIEHPDRSVRQDKIAQEAEAAQQTEAKAEKQIEDRIEDSIIQKPDIPEMTETEEAIQASSEMEKLVEDRIDQMEHESPRRAEDAKPETLDKKDDLADSDQDVDDIVTPFKRCFDSEGHFHKGSFEKNIPALAKHGDQVFKFIWQYLKGTMIKDDRLALLNSLYLLVNKINQSEKAVGVLLKDIFSKPNKVNISDRNGLMLASLVIRKYNKELNREIELTPEEVFLVKEGLIGSAVKAASGIIENNPKKVMQKHMTVYTGITKSLTLNEVDETSMPFRYLLNLEREACIFLSLVGGPTPRAVIRDAVKSYGDPESDIYNGNGDYSHITAVLQQLKILVRGLGRIGEKEDIPVLEDLKKKEQGFMRFSQDPFNQEMIQRIMKWAGDSVKNISQETTAA